MLSGADASATAGMNCKQCKTPPNWCQLTVRPHAYPLCHFERSVAIPVAVATAVSRRVFNLIEIATSLDELGMSGRSSQ